MRTFFLRGVHVGQDSGAWSPQRYNFNMNFLVGAHEVAGGLFVGMVKLRADSIL